MKLALGHGLAALTVVAGAIAVFAACQHNDSSLFVQDVIYPTPAAQGQTCTYTADPNQTFLSHGKIDVGFPTTGYQAEFLIGNQLVAESNSAQLATETSTININAAIITDTAADGTQLDQYTWLTGGSVYPSTGTVPGYAAIGAVIASPKAIAALAGAARASDGTETLITYTKFIGHTLGGTYIESNVFEYAIDVCYGCLVDYSEMDVLPLCNTKTNLPVEGVVNCLGASSTSTSGSTAFPCYPGQDTPIDCAACQGYPVCHGNIPLGVGLCDGGTGG
jgi:hypothetical protein